MPRRLPWFEGGAVMRPISALCPPKARPSEQLILRSVRHDDVSGIGQIEHGARPLVQRISVDMAGTEAGHPPFPDVALGLRLGLLRLGLGQQRLALGIGHKPVVPLHRIPAKVADEGQKDERRHHRFQPALDLLSEWHGPAPIRQSILTSFLCARKTVAERQTRFLGTSRKGRSLSVRGSLGIPSTRSEIMLRWISSVPPAIEPAGTETSISAISPFIGPSSPASIASLPEINVCTRAAARATWLEISLPSEPSGPCGLPCICAARARRAVHCAAFDMHNSLAISCRTTGSAIRPVAFARSNTRSTRPARCGYHLYGSITVAISARSSSYTRPGRSDAMPQLEIPSAPRRSCINVVVATAQPLPTSPTKFSGGTSASVKNTWLNDAYPFIWRRGRTSTPGWWMSKTKYVSPWCLGTSQLVRASS